MRARRQEDPTEENPPEENYAFTPVESPYYQNGDENLREAVQQSMALLTRSLPKTIDVEMDVESGPPLWVNADRTQLQQILLNLAANAHDAMPNGGKLRVSLAPATEADLSGWAGVRGTPMTWVSLKISDTGVGMPAEVRSRIFEPFFTTKGVARGTGLGLPIVRGMVQSHGGHIDVRSEVGSGTTVSIVLPSVQAPAALEAPGPRAPVPKGRGELILLAEEDRFRRRLTSGYLESLGYAVVQVVDGDGLLDRGQDHKDDIKLLVLDADIPKRGGLAYLRELRAAGIAAAAIVMIDGVDEGLLNSLADHTVVLRKPFRADALGRLVASMLRSGPGTPADELRQ